MMKGTIMNIHMGFTSFSLEEASARRTFLAVRTIDDPSSAIRTLSKLLFETHVRGKYHVEG